MGEHVYHHTDTMRLAHILDAGELRPGTCAKAETHVYPDRDFVWGTTHPQRARSATAFFDNTNHQDDRVWAVRFTLAAEDFEPWSAVTNRDAAWTPDLIERFNQTSQGDKPADWHIHRGTLGRSKWVAIHARQYLQPWLEIPLDLPVYTRTNPDKGLPLKTIMFGGRIFQSTRVSENPVSYEFGMMGVTDRAERRLAELFREDAATSILP